MAATNQGNIAMLVGAVVIGSTAAQATMPMPASCVIFAPPSRSQIGPASTRATLPTSGP